MKSLTYVEIDIPVCSLTYGTSPCTASIPETGTKKCFNSRKTCQDLANIDLEDTTLRFAIDTDYLPRDIEAFPCIVGVSHDGAVISIGKDLGIRASLQVTFREFRHTDTGPGLDKYTADRSYDPYTHGTFWARFRARQPFLRGQSIRLIRGLLGDTLESMETRHYVIESFSGPTPDGVYTIVAKDILKLTDNERATCPVVNNGVLNAAITNVATSATLTPTGIGDLEYPASGYATIGGKEVVLFSRSGDSLTITRAQFNTVAIAHNQADRVQVMQQFTATDPADLLLTFLLFSGVPGSYVPHSEWQAETAAYLQQLYTGYIAEPTGCGELINEVLEVAGLYLWWDDLNRKLRLRVIREIAAEAAIFNDLNILEGSLTIEEQPDARLSQVWVYYGQRNPLEPLSRLDNYPSIEVTFDGDAEESYGSSLIHVLPTRWIALGGRSIASRTGQLILARYRDPPRKFSFEVWRNSEQSINDVQLGGSYQLGSWAIQDDEGNPANVPIIVTSLRPGPDRYIVEAEELSLTFNAQSGSGDPIDPFDPDAHVIVIDNDAYNVNLRTLHDTLYGSIGPDAGDITVTCYINSGVKVGSSSTALPAFDIGTWEDAATPITLIVNGRIQGKGGNGGLYNVPGTVGGPALYSRKTFTLQNNGQIWGGGGGGGGSRNSSQTPPTFTGQGGGGGAGFNPGSGGNPQPTNGLSGANGTTEAGGAGAGPFFGSDAGDGGGPGQSGGSGTGGVENSAGAGPGLGLDGNSFATIQANADMRGGVAN